MSDSQPAAAPEQRVLLARYGVRECPLVEFVGPFDMDIAAEGVAQAHLLAARLAASPVAASIHAVYCSPFLRAAHTGAILAERLGVPLRVEHGLTEWLDRSLVGDAPYEPRTPAALAALFPCLDAGWASLHSPSFPESEASLLERCGATLARLAAHAAAHAPGAPSFVCVSHAPVLLGLAMACEGSLDCPARSALAPYPIGGLYQFVRSASGWTCELAGATDHLLGDAAAGVQRWTLPCLAAHAPPPQ